MQNKETLQLFLSFFLSVFASALLCCGYHCFFYYYFRCAGCLRFCASFVCGECVYVVCAINTIRTTYLHTNVRCTIASPVHVLPMHLTSQQLPALYFLVLYIDILGKLRPQQDNSIATNQNLLISPHLDKVTRQKDPEKLDKLINQLPYSTETQFHEAIPIPIPNPSPSLRPHPLPGSSAPGPPSPSMTKCTT
ncbi:hypothetical protein BD289DRAFT_273765 [Coniella lustricola]|uniref:Uncharacterized protein n=1 Tax=Coniella lustricola TaxID=2025994 RepID=A0A2T3A6W9_9PEZI|nr:hypothetical protein BD289DRAFT_273765 [Coniella lustricola]